MRGTASSKVTMRVSGNRKFLKVPKEQQSDIKNFQQTQERVKRIMREHDDVLKKLSDT